MSGRVVERKPDGSATVKMTPDMSPMLQEAEAYAHANALPVCPYCGQDPIQYKGRTAYMGQFTLLQVFCANLECRKLFTAEVVSIAQPKSTSRIVVPG